MLYNKLSFGINYLKMKTPSVCLKQIRNFTCGNVKYIQFTQILRNVGIIENSTKRLTIPNWKKTKNLFSPNNMQFYSFYLNTVLEY